MKDIEINTENREELILKNLMDIKNMHDTAIRYINGYINQSKEALEASAKQFLHTGQESDLDSNKVIVAKIEGMCTLAFHSGLISQEEHRDFVNKIREIEGVPSGFSSLKEYREHITKLRE